MNLPEAHLAAANRWLREAEHAPESQAALPWLLMSLAHSLLAVGISLQSTVSHEAIEHLMVGLHEYVMFGERHRT